MKVFEETTIRLGIRVPALFNPPNESLVKMILAEEPTDWENLIAPLPPTDLVLPSARSPFPLFDVTR